jgi:hypothetical protein
VECSRLSVRGATNVRRSAIAPRFEQRSDYSRALAYLVLVGFRSAHYQPATQKFLIVQFLHGAFRFLDGLHLHKSKTFRALIVPVTYDLSILHVPHAVEQFKAITLSSVEGQVSNVKAGRSDFNPFRFARRSRRLRTIARLRCGFAFLPAVSEKFGNPLPECLFLSLRCSLSAHNAFVIFSASAPTARAAWASSG